VKADRLRRFGRATLSPGEKDWHGAMTHIAIQEKLDGEVVEWMEQVSDKQYRVGK
jgi:hypothetical protein